MLVSAESGRSVILNLQEAFGPKINTIVRSAKSRAQLGFSTDAASGHLQSLPDSAGAVSLANSARFLLHFITHTS
jgi:hypothetical protein